MPGPAPMGSPAGGGRTGTTSTIEADVRPGGAYRIEASRHGIAVSGEYLVVEPERRLAFTWVWIDDDGASRDEAVDVAFARAGGGTPYRVRHTGPWDDDAPADSYRQGWEFVLAELVAGALRLTG